MNIANDKIIGKHRDLDDALNFVARQFVERDLATENLSLRVNRKLKDMTPNSGRQPDTIDMASPVQPTRTHKRAFPGQAFPQCNTTGPDQSQA